MSNYLKPIFKYVFIYLLALKFKSKIWIYRIISIFFTAAVVLFSIIRAEQNFKIFCQNLNDFELSRMNNELKRSFGLIRNLTEREKSPINNKFFSKEVGYAVFTGFNHYVNIEKDLCKNFTNDEICGVTAHELGHYINGDCIFSFSYFRIFDILLSFL